MNDICVICLLVYHFYTYINNDHSIVAFDTSLVFDRKSKWRIYALHHVREREFCIALSGDLL